MNKSTLLEIADRKNKILPADQKSQQLAKKKKRSTLLEIADRKNKILSAEQKSQQLALREQKQVARCLLPDVPPRKQKRKASLTRTPLIPPPRKLRSREVLSTSTGPINPSTSTACSSRVDDKDEAVPTTVEELESVQAKTSATNSGKLLFSATDGIQTVDEKASNTVVPADIQLIGFTLTSSTRHSVSSVSPAESTSSVTNISDGIEEQITEWEKNVGVNPGSDVDEDLLDGDDVDIRVPRQRNVEEYPVELADLSSHHLQLLDEIDARDDAALRELVSSEDTLHFHWRSDPNIFTGEREHFTGPSGPTFSTKGMSPLDIFERIWDEAIINLIVTETNRYASHLINDATLLQNSRLKRWSDINKSDLWTFFAVVMLQSLVPNPVEKEYWYPQLPYMRIGNFKEIMSHRKFSLIKRCLHFVDNASVHDTKSREHSKLYKIMPILDHLNCKFSGLYLPEQNIAIDESLLLWEGRLNFSQLIANKAARVGIKSYELCESRTGYLWKMEVYAGKGHQVSEEHDVERINVHEGATSQIVYRLVSPLLNKGHTLTMDNFYNSPLLSRTLKSKKTDTIGTLRLNREFVPDSLKNKTKANMRQGELAYSQTQDLSVVVWRDFNLVSLISTYHKVEVSGTEKHGVYKYKPKVVLDYDLSMGGVDTKDQLLQAFPVERIRNSVWYKKLFRRLLNVSIHNAHIIFTHHKKIPQRQFRTTLADEILKKYKPQAGRSLPPAEVPKTGHFPVKTKGRTRCKLCARRKIEVRTVWACDTCGVSLCIIDCFKKYHTSESSQ